MTAVVRHNASIFVYFSLSPLLQRPTVTVFKADGAAGSSTPLPAVFSAPIRRDVVHFVHTNIAKNGKCLCASVEFGSLL
jgi:hypothetical protein